MRRWSKRVGSRLRDAVIRSDDLLDAARRRFDAKFSRNAPVQIVAYRGFADASGAELSGRVLADPPVPRATADDAWWDNLLDTYRRFESDEVAGAALEIRFRDARAETVSDAEGYYRIDLATDRVASSALWEHATVALLDGSLTTRQPVLQIGPEAKFGVISDIDDTVLHSHVTDWKRAAQLALLHNARTRKPLEGIAPLYRALQTGAGPGRSNPIFYVSSSPWNLYDLLDDFLELNSIPAGPLFLRDYGTDAGKLVASPGHVHKLERARDLVRRLPQLRWILIGDSGQADAELYATLAREVPERILAIYIRDVDLVTDSPRDRSVDGWIERVAGTRVPMLRVADSSVIAAHAFGLGLIQESTLPEIEREVRRDQRRPSLSEAAR